VEVLVTWHPADGRLFGEHSTANAIDDPLQHPHILAIAGPEESSLRILAEPIDLEDLRRLAERPLHLDPMPEIVAHVIAAERKHRHRIAAQCSDAAGRRRGR